MVENSLGILLPELNNPLPGFFPEATDTKGQDQATELAPDGTGNLFSPSNAGVPPMQGQGAPSIQGQVEVLPSQDQTNQNQGAVISVNPISATTQKGIVEGDGTLYGLSSKVDMDVPIWSLKPDASLQPLPNSRNTILSGDYFSNLVADSQPSDFVVGSTTKIESNADKARFQCQATVQGPTEAVKGVTSVQFPAKTDPVTDHYRLPQGQQFWDSSVTGFEFNARDFIESHRNYSFTGMVVALKSHLCEVNKDLVAIEAELNADNIMSCPGISSQTTSESITAASNQNAANISAVVNSLPTSGFAAKTLTPEEEDFLSRKYWVTPTPVSSAFPGLYKGACGALSAFNRKQLATNALVAEILNLLARNPPKSLVDAEKEILQNEKLTPGNDQWSRNVRAVENKLKAKFKELAEAKKDLKLAEQDLERLDQFDDTGRREKYEKVIAWKKGAAQTVSSEVEDINAELLVAQNERDANIGPTGGNKDSGNSNFTGLSRAKWESDTYLFHKIENGEAVRKRAVYMNEKLFEISVVPGAEKVSDVKAFLEIISDGARSTAAGAPSAALFLPKHSLEASFCRKASTKGDFLSVLIKPATYEQGKEYLHLYNPELINLHDSMLENFLKEKNPGSDGNTDGRGIFNRVNSDTSGASIGVSGSAGAQNESTAIQVAEHYLTIRALNGPFSFDVCLNEEGYFMGIDCALRTYTNGNSPMEVSDLLLKQEALECVDYISSALIALTLARANESISESGDAKALTTSKLPILAIVQAALYYDVKMYPCYGGDLVGLRFLLKQLLKLSPRHSYEKDRFAKLLDKSVLAKIPSDEDTLSTTSGNLATVSHRGLSLDSYIDRLKRIELSFLHTAPKVGETIALKTLQNLIENWIRFQKDVGES